MRQKLQTRAFEQVAPVMEAGEQPLVATRAMVGRFSASRLGTIITQGAIQGAVGAALTANKRQFAVLTNRRLIFLPQNFMGGPGRKVLADLPREQISLAEAKFGTVSQLRIAFGGGDGVSLTFPRVDKKNAESLAGALRQVPTA